MHAMMEVVLSILLLNDRGEILVLQMPSGQWQLVGGRVNQGESWLEAIRRETREEINCHNFTIDSVISVDNWVWEGIPQFGVFLSGHLEDTRIELSDDHIAYKWLRDAEELATADYFHPSLQVMAARVLRGEMHYQPL